MENKGIPNRAVTALNFLPVRQPWQARLNNIQNRRGFGFWSAFPNTIGQYLQIDLGKETVVSKVATQGSPSMDQWVTSYKITFSSDGTNWNESQNNGVVKVNAVK